MNVAKIVSAICISIISVSAYAHGPKHDHHKKDHHDCREMSHHKKHDHHKKHKKHDKHCHKHDHHNHQNQCGHNDHHDHDSHTQHGDQPHRPSFEVTLRGERGEVIIRK